MTASSLPPGLVDRFRADLEALLGGGLESDDRFALAVSGGPDSLALLRLAAAALANRIETVTVDHGLRPESAAEAAHVAAVCANLGVPHRTLKVAVPKSGNLQAGARAARYTAIGTWLDEAGIPWLLTGHQLDDQAETLLMRLLRGAGVRGLAGMPAKGRWPSGQSRARVLRPLLGWRRAELAEIAAPLDPVDDPGNRDERFERVRVRNQLAAAPWLDPAALALSAAALRDADEALDWTVARLREERLSRGAVLELRPVDWPPEILRRLLLSILAECGPGPAPRTDELARLARTLAAGDTATLAGVKCSGGAVWRFEPAPPRRPSA